MGLVEEIPDDSGDCPSCGQLAQTKCTGCKAVYYCNRQCQKNHWKKHKLECKVFPYKAMTSEELGKYLVANKDLKKGELIMREAPLVIGPSQITIPVCLSCYTPVDGSYKCPRSGWPLCGPTCAKAVQHNPEVVVPAQCEASFEIEDYTEPCYLYECVTVLRALLLQKSAPAKFKTLMSMESHQDLRSQADIDRTKEKVIDVIKKTLGIMVFEAICPEYDFSDETIQKIQGVLDTNKKEIRLAYSDVDALFPTAYLMEHSCEPNTKMFFDKDYSIVVRAGRDIKAGENLSTMYTHALWGTVARRDHLSITKKFWCRCPRCKDPTEFGTYFSAILDNGHVMLPRDPLNPDSDWVCDKTGATRQADDVKLALSAVGRELEVLQHKGIVDEYEQFLARQASFLHSNHYHMVTAKHNLLQMYGRTEGCLIQDMTDEQLARKEQLCRENIDLLRKLDADKIRLGVYMATDYYELHLPLLQVAKRKWESGKVATEEFRVLLEEPFNAVKTASELLKDETNEALPEGQLLLQVKDTLSQLEGFMKTVGCQM